MIVLSVVASTTMLPAQEQVAGTVKDSAGNPVISASVSITDTISGAGLDFSRTDGKGQFMLLIPTGTGIRGLAVKVVATGYTKALLALTEPLQPVNVILRRIVNELPPVTVRNTSLVRFKGDTLSYTASDFSDQHDRVIGDVLKKIPGIEIADNGIIKYQGKAINYFYIDGDNLLDGRYSIATNNIPSGIVDKVQVIERNQHIKMLNGIVLSEMPAINITIKDKSKINLVNTAKIAVGMPQLYNVELVNMAFRSRFKAINTLKANNTGTDLLDEAKSLGQLNPAATGEVQMPLLTAGIGALPEVNKKRYLFNRSGIINLNNLVKTKNELSFRLSGHYLPDRQQQEYNYQSIYFLPGDTISIKESRNLYATRKNLQLQLSADKNTSNRFFNNTLIINYQHSAERSSLQANNSPVNQELTDRLFSIANYLHVIKIVGKKQIIDFFSYLNYDNRPQELVVSPGLHKDLLNNGTTYKQSVQKTAVPVYLLHHYLNYRKSSGRFSQTYKAGILYQRSDILSELKIFQNNGTATLLPINFSNNLEWTNRKIYIDARYEWQTERNLLSVVLPFQHNHITYQDTGLQKRAGTDRLFVTPSIFWRYRIGKEHVLSAHSAYDTRLSSSSDVYSGTIMNNYRSFLSNDVPIQQTDVYSIGSSFEFKRTIKMFFVRASYNFSESIANFMYASNISNNILQRVTIPMRNSIYAHNATFDISNYIFSLKTSVSGGYLHSQTHFQQQQNGGLFPVKTISDNLSLRFRLKLLSSVTFNYETHYGWTKTSVNNEKGPYVQASRLTRQLLNVDIFLSERLSLNMRNEYYHNMQALQPASSFNFADAYIRYKILKPFTDLEFSCQNLTNTDAFTMVYTSANVLATNSFRLRPRMWLLRISFGF